MYSFGLDPSRPEPKSPSLEKLAQLKYIEGDIQNLSKLIQSEEETLQMVVDLFELHCVTHPFRGHQVVYLDGFKALIQHLCILCERDDCQPTDEWIRWIAKRYLVDEEGVDLERFVLYYRQVLQSFRNFALRAYQATKLELDPEGSDSVSLLSNKKSIHYLSGDPGNRLDDYLTKLKPIGDGGTFGNIYLAKDRKRLGRRVVVKEFIPQHIGSLSPLDMRIMDAEYRFLMSADHPNLVSIHEVYRDDRTQYIVMEHIPGGDLYELAYGHVTVSERYICLVLKQLLEGISYCHSQGVLHRDLKPANVMLLNPPFDEVTGLEDDMPVVKIVDFGAAYHAPDGEAEDEDDQSCGSPLFMSPEGYRSLLRKASSKRSDLPSKLGTKFGTGVKNDIWGIGIIFYELLFGQHPLTLIYPHADLSIEDMELYSVLKKVLVRGRSFPFKREINGRRPSNLAYDLLLKMLTFKPSQRPDAKECLRHPWFAEVGQEVPLREHRLEGILKRLENFSKMNSLQIYLLNLVSHHLAFQASEAVQLFKEFDKDNDGSISRQELSEALTGLGMDIATTDRLGNVLDADQSDDITCSEFIAGCHTFDGTNEFAVKLAFKELVTRPAQGSGQPPHLVAENLIHLFRDTVDFDVLQTMMAFIDTDGDGTISYEEFRNFIYNAN